MDIQAKLKEFENFIEEKLKPDLRDIEVLLAETVSQHKEWTELKVVVDSVKEFKENDEDMHIQYNIGSDIRGFATISDYESVYIDVGLGVILEMNCEEAIKYSNIRLRLLQKKIDQLRSVAVNVKVHIKMTLLAINELQATLGIN